MNGAKNSLNGEGMKSAIVEEQETMVGGRSCPQLLIFDVGIDGNGGFAQVASGTLIGNRAGLGSLSTGFLSQFPSAQDWANAYHRVLVN